MQDRNNKKFGSLYSGEWLYDTSLGVGVELKGNPVDTDSFIEILMDFACNRVAALRILNDLLTIGERKVTVMYQLDFLELNKRLDEINISIKIIPPASHSSSKYFEYSANWDNEIQKIINDELTLDEVLKNKLPIERKIFKERYEDAMVSLALMQVSEFNK